jgi:hypothetical protein
MSQMGLSSSKKLAQESANALADMKATGNATDWTMFGSISLS